MKRLLLALSLFAGCASAATVTISWAPPVLNTDESPIPATGAGSLTQYRVEYGTCVGTAFGTRVGEVIRTAPATGTTLNLQPGQTCVRVFAQNTYGVESDASNVATSVVLPPKPRPPTNATAGQ